MFVDLYGVVDRKRIWRIYKPRSIEMEPMMKNTCNIHNGSVLCVRKEFNSSVGFCVMTIFVAKNLHYFTQKFSFFAHEAEQLLPNIPHCSASHATRFVHIFAKLFPQFAQKSKFGKIIFANSKTVQKPKFCATTKSLREN